jgi:hypothetical protein
MSSKYISTHLVVPQSRLVLLGKCNASLIRIAETSRESSLAMLGDERSCALVDKLKNN